MRSYPMDTAYDGDYVTPYPVNAELTEIVDASNALTSDNVSVGILAPGHAASDAWGSYLRNGHVGPEDHDHDRAPSKNDVYAIPTDAAEPWIERITTGDALLEVVLTAEYEGRTTSGGTGIVLLLWVGVRVDGTLVTQSPCGDLTETADSRAALALVPVGAGEHVVELVYGLHPGVLPPSNLRVRWHNRALTLREIAR